ncbi:putative transcription factor bZIP family [Helianthus annuus]|uniref:Putative basic-leucine zipper domain-containing protein n=1 Tax=Helianthus annuus TaxID=4232 RepID=A0A251SAC9_HELAN|nr:bZIP transcription factor 27 [Helianthus annuus]KAF5765878.1 putative transcription factor bZIP family [Helianthus annuus]KAJ0452348.1 putative transcription factor bZIP family [Helianthus annuus]KAJ0474243.1 putative transcription factor bZIP family [Helianthus annuus]KAJ0649805.1 putative transcription factor bZIP family [Helianthus annuus]KAJ0653594.1 putative transcription factor bZIP family [Helianthus annuus]
MLSHGDHDANTLNTNNHNINFRVSSRSTTLSSSSSSNTSSNLSIYSNNTRTMEEVWKDINLSTTNHPTAAVKGYRGFILQDFLAKPFSSNDTPTSVSSPQPPVLLTLNSGLVQLDCLTEDQTPNICSLNVPFERVLGSADSCSGLFGHNIGGMRILPEDGTGGDRRHKRMIKNRESAARSRARKQAYTNELENEVERLKVENAKLKRQQKQLELATKAQMTKKRGLQRTSTAPF